MSPENHQTSEHELQSILKNVSVGGNLTTGDISQILNLFVIVHQTNSFIPKGIPYNLPTSNTIKFVGRSDTLEHLHQTLQENNQVAITAIEGMGGVGKTELATQYCLLHLLLNTYPGGICWLRARDEDVGIQILRFAEARLGIKPPEDWDLLNRVDYCWSRWQEKKEGDVLVVLDDVNDYPKILPYLPPQLSQFKVLITTRLELDLSQSFSLNVLTEAASLELLSQWIEEENIDSQLADAKELCLRLGYLPLALNLVGRYLKKRKISLAEMLQRLERKGLQHKALDVDEKDRTRTLNIQRGVAAAFELSWEELSENAKELGCLLGLFALAPIPWDLVESASEGDAEVLEDARVELEHFHLLQGGETYSLHQLIRDFFRQKLEQLDVEPKNLAKNTIADKQFIFKRIIQNFVGTFLLRRRSLGTDNNKKEKLKKSFAVATSTIARNIKGLMTVKDIQNYSYFIPHIAEVASYLKDYIDDRDLVFHFRGLGRYYGTQGFFLQALPWYEECLTVAKLRLQPGHQNIADSYKNLADIYTNVGRYKDAELMATQALQIYKNIDGNSPADNVALGLGALAGVYRDQGDYEKSLSLDKQALEIGRRLNSNSLQVSLCNIAYTHWALGNYNEAENLYMEALDLVKSQGNDRELAIILCNLAALYRVQKRYSEAESFYKQALEIKLRVLREGHLEVAVNRYGLAMLYDAQERNNEAQQLYIQSLIAFESSVGQDSRWTVECKQRFENFLRRTIPKGHPNLKSLSDNSFVQAIIAKVQDSLEKSD